MSGRLIIDGNAVYEVDEDCMKYQRGKRMAPSRNLRENETVCSQTSAKKGGKAGYGRKAG